MWRVCWEMEVMIYMVVEIEMHVLFECTLYEEEREKCSGAVGWYG